jgi:phosphoribosyl 1,2-cyclic phosphodiesterase
VNARIWGTRGSVPTPRLDTGRYGGNTACIEIETRPESRVVLDAGTGICGLGPALPPEVTRIDILLGHLHMDHILGLGFFTALFDPDVEVHIWGPGSTVHPLRARLTRYLSPPLFPVLLRDLPCRLEVHDIPLGTFELPGMSVTTSLVCHPGPTVGLRLDGGSGTLVYLSDHEPALGARSFPEESRWTSGFDLAAGCDVLVHDAQYTDDEYKAHVGWGHSSVRQAIAFAKLAEVRQMVAFHHDPWHDDDTLDRIYADVVDPPVPVTVAVEGMTISL